MNSIDLIEKERKRLIEDEGFNREHNKMLKYGELAVAGALYALNDMLGTLDFDKLWEDYWPCIHPGLEIEINDKSRIEQLAVAGALITAEIDRLMDDGVS